MSSYNDHLAGFGSKQMTVKYLQNDSCFDSSKPIFSSDSVDSDETATGLNS